MQEHAISKYQTTLYCSLILQPYVTELICKHKQAHMRAHTHKHTTGYVNNKDCIWNVKNTENTCMQKCLDPDRAVLLQYRHNMPLTI